MESDKLHKLIHISLLILVNSWIFIPTGKTLAQDLVSDARIHKLFSINNGANLAIIEKLIEEDKYSLEIIDSSTLSIISVQNIDISLQSEIFDVNADGSWVVFGGDFEGVAVQEIETGIRSGVAPEGPLEIVDADWNPVDGRIVHGEGSLGIISVIYDDEGIKGGDVLNDNAVMTGFAWSPDGTRLATTSYSNIENESYLQVWTEDELTNPLSTEASVFIVGGSWDMKWSLTSNYLAGITQGGIRIYDLDNQQLYRFFETPDIDYLYSLSWSPDGLSIATGYEDVIWIWDVENGELIDTITTEGIVNKLIWLPLGIIHNGTETGLYLDGTAVTAPLESTD